MPNTASFPDSSTATIDCLAFPQETYSWVDPTTLRIEPALERLSPEHSLEEFRALTSSIKANKVTDPLIVWTFNNIVLDGLTRRRLSIQHHGNTPVPVRFITLEDERIDTAILWVVNKPRERRNLIGPGSEL